MNPLKTVLVGIAVIAFVGIGLWKFGWSPLNVLFGPQYETQKTTTEDSRRRFVQVTVPQTYPMLVKFLRTKGSETLSWNSQSGESQLQVLKLSADGLLIETAIIVGRSRSDASSPTGKTNVRMLDRNLDGQMDLITYTVSSGEIHEYQAPFDETSQLLWDSALAITFRFNACCH